MTTDYLILLGILTLTMIVTLYVVYVFMKESIRHNRALEKQINDLERRMNGR